MKWNKIESPPKVTGWYLVWFRSDLFGGIHFGADYWIENQKKFINFGGFGIEFWAEVKRPEL